MITNVQVRRVTLFLLLVALWFLFGCSNQDRIVVGSKNFSEQVILGELLAQQIERRTDLQVDRKLNLGGTFICHQALEYGDIDLYVEYTGTALTAILKRDPVQDPAEAYRIVKNEYHNLNKLEWLDPLGFNNTFAMIIRGADARQLNAKTISDVAKYTPQWRAGFGYEFMERKDGFEGLSYTYGLKFKEPPRIMDLTLTYTAVASKQVDFIAGNSTDGLIDKLDLFVLEDDKKYFPPYEAAVVIRSDSMEQHPELRAVLQELSGKISEQKMRKMNYQVDVEKRAVKTVVQEFLKGIGR
jgi:glycine betaine/choline ABC-type transport system substrate-binding protein